MKRAGSAVEVNAGRMYVEQHLSAMRYFKSLHEHDGTTFHGDASPVYEFLLKHGVEFKGTPWKEFLSKYRKMEKRMCFANSWEAALKFPNLTYYEGFAYAGTIIVHHGWCVDERGRVVDFTWRETGRLDCPADQWEYFGIGWNADELKTWMQQKFTSSLLFEMDYSEPDQIEEFIVPLPASASVRRAQEAYTRRELREGRPVQTALEVGA